MNKKAVVLGIGELGAYLLYLVGGHIPREYTAWLVFSRDACNTCCKIHGERAAFRYRGLSAGGGTQAGPLF